MRIYKSARGLVPSRRISQSSRFAMAQLQPEEPPGNARGLLRSRGRIARVECGFFVVANWGWLRHLRWWGPGLAAPGVRAWSDFGLAKLHLAPSARSAPVPSSCLPDAPFVVAPTDRLGWC